SFGMPRVVYSVPTRRSSDLLESGEVEALIMNASGCGAFVKEYPFYLRNEPEYAQKARYLVQHVKDIAELIAPEAARLKGMFKKRSEEHTSELQSSEHVVCSH